MQYAGLAFQLGATIAIGAFIGRRLDQWFELEHPFLTILFLLLFTAVGFYSALKDLI